MIILAFDPGKETGHAFLDFTSGRPLLRSYAVLAESDIEHTLATELHCADRADPVVAVEVNEVYATRERNFNPVHLIRAGRIAGQIIGYARALDVRVVTFSAHEWRGAIVGDRTPSDADIKRVLSRLVELPKQSNNHERDAIGCGLYAHRLLTSSAKQWLALPKPWRPARRRTA